MPFGTRTRSGSALGEERVVRALAHRRLVPLAELAAEHVDRDGHRLRVQLRIKPALGTFVAHEGVRPVELMPAELAPRFVECGVSEEAPRVVNMRVLPPVDHQQLHLAVGELWDASEGVLLRRGSKAHAISRVHVRRVPAGRGGDARLERGAHRQVPSDAEPRRTHLAGGGRVAGEERHHRGRVRVIATHLLCFLEFVAAVCAGVVILPHPPGGAVGVVVDLRDGDDEAMSREVGRCADNRRGPLEDLGIKDDGRIPPAGDGADDARGHGSCRSLQNHILLLNLQAPPSRRPRRRTAACRVETRSAQRQRGATAERGRAGGGDCEGGRGQHERCG
mmetsp:Transcript_1546/g.3600  ORF Transcript_1546/g.3600 Transcript_1546/m.3600 type:complete len:335 (+) Transcript_1546:109-1113(+)